VILHRRRAARSCECTRSHSRPSPAPAVVRDSTALDSAIALGRQSVAAPHDANGYRQAAPLRPPAAPSRSLLWWLGPVLRPSQSYAKPLGRLWHLGNRPQRKRCSSPACPRTYRQRQRADRPACGRPETISSAPPEPTVMRCRLRRSSGSRDGWPPTPSRSPADSPTACSAAPVSTPCA